ncbi:MAG: lipid A biosynthesis acyltransferase [Zoogloeaceae bacterium]|jgi:KDO2-lipid IV(A) lauroyltransferase|nr:lipid A biosynthesis acyltransferase [Zoogloeaceae bacterium]
MKMSSIRSFARDSFARLVLALLWLLHYLPLSALRKVGFLLGIILFHTARARREIARVNLRLCFPDMDRASRKQLLRRHFIVFSQSLLDRTLFWWASPARLSRLLEVRGWEHVVRSDNTPTLLLAPHFAGLDAGGVAVTMRTSGVSVYSRQKRQPVFDQAILKGRTRFNQPLLISRTEGIRRAIKAMKQGLPFYYLPDMDLGREDSIFVPFFGVLAATVPGVSRLVRATGAKVVPVVSRMTEKGYTIDFLPPWEDFPGESVEADTLFMNRFIEQCVQTMPEQYHWLHKRFKTRPPGEAKFYSSKTNSGLKPPPSGG